MNVRILVMLLVASVPGSVLATPPKAPAAQRAKPAAKPKSQEKSGDVVEQQSELAAIRQSSRNFVDAFNRRDAKAVAALWTVDGDYVDDSGQVYAGRQAIEDAYTQHFSNGVDRQMHVVIDSLRLLSKHAAIEDGRAMVDPPGPGAPSISKYTAVHVKVDGKWMMSTVRDVREETPSAYHQVAGLEFLVGTWTAEANGAKLQSVCKWVANKSFIKREYTIARHDHSITSGIQLIGFNPESGKIQSWNFTSDGGHAIGVWTPAEHGWSADVRGVTLDGALTTSVVSLTKVDENAYIWQSTQRTAGDASLADTGEVLLKRQATK